jgi:CheY-like chemotaxis protein
MEAVIEELPRLTMLTANTAEAGIDLVRLHRPNLVVMDINLPGMSGIEAKRRLDTDPATHGIPVVALSAAAMPRDKKQANAAGFARYLTKPIDIDELTTTLEQILG